MYNVISLKEELKISLTLDMSHTKSQALLMLTHIYMGDFNQPQQKYAGTGENCNIAIPVIFYPVIKTFCAHYLGV